MKLTAKSQLAIMSLFELALQGSKKPLNLAELARRRGVSLSYLEQIFSHLKACGLVSSSRGPGGGYFLGRDSADISVSEIVDAVYPQETLATDAGLVEQLWADFSDDVHEYLSQINLKSLVENHNGIAAETRSPALSSLGSFSSELKPDGVTAADS